MTYLPSANAMERVTIRQLLTPASWEWPLVTFSLHVVFHQYPLMMFGGPLRIHGDIVLFFVLPLVCLYVGWKAKEFVGMDVAFGTMLYAAIVEVLIRLRTDIPVFRSDIWFAVAGLFVIGVAAYTVALAGRLWRHRQLRKAGYPV